MAEKQYIEREMMLARVDEEFFKTDPSGEEQLGFLKCRRIIRELPAADVAPVVHARWIDRDGKTWCSRCDASNKQYKPPYCPHCGAKMDSERKEDTP
jgi:hypothetical protein